MGTPNGVFMGSLQNDWAIILFILILTCLQAYKIFVDSKASKGKLKFDSRLEGTMGSIELYLKILSDKYTEEVTDIQMPILVHEFVGHVKESIIVEAAASVTRNNVRNNKREIEAKMEQFICNRYKDMVMNLGRFKWRGTSMSAFVDMTLKQKIIDNVLDVVLTERDTNTLLMDGYRLLGSSMDQRFDELENSIKTKAYG